jgi:hypothetical protein
LIYCLQSRVYSYIALTFVFLLLSFVPTTTFQILNVVSATLESGGGGDDSGGDVGDWDSGDGGGDQPEPGPNLGPELNPDPDPNPGLVADPTPKPPTDPCEENPKAEGCAPEPPDDDCLYDPSLPKCASIDGKCPEGFNMNEDGQCYPDKPCPLGFARVDNDESGACLPVDQV